MVRICEELGYSIALHAIGDKAIDSVLESFTGDSSGPDGIQKRIEHFEMASDIDMGRAAKNDVIICMQPNFVGEWGLDGGMYEKAVGRERTMRMNRFRSVLESGCRLCFGSDCMPLSPLYGIHWAVNHPNADERLSVDEAIMAYTGNAAKVCNFPGCGILKAGYSADMVTLSRDPFDNPSSIMGIDVEMTFFRGEVVFSQAIPGE